MSRIAAASQSQSTLNHRNVAIQGSMLEGPKDRRKATRVKRWKSLTRIFELKKKSSARLRQASWIPIDIDIPDCDIEELRNSDLTQSLCYSPSELAAIILSGGRSKRWAFCLTSTPVVFDQNSEDGCRQRDKGGVCDRNAEEEEDGDRRPTLYLVLDPDQDPSSSSEVRLLVGTREELCGQTGGGDGLEKGL